MSIAGLGTTLNDGKVSQAEAKDIVAKAKASGNPDVAGAIQDELAQYVDDPQDAAVLAQQIVDSAQSPSPHDVLLVEFPGPTNATPVAGAPAGPKYGVQHTTGLNTQQRVSAVRTALSSGDVSEARRLYAQSSPQDRARIAFQVLHDPSATPAMRDQMTRLLATDPNLDLVLKAAPSTTELRTLLGAAARGIEKGQAGTGNLSSAEATIAKNRMAQFFVSNPQKVDEVFGPAGTTPAATFSADDRKSVAKLVMPAFVDKAPANYDNHTRVMTLAQEACPGSSTRDIVRTMRRAHYTDGQMNALPGFGCGKYEPADTADNRWLASTCNKGSMGRWKEIPGPGGKKTDLSHTLCALDAQMNSGRIDAWVLTHGGDSGQEISNFGKQVVKGLTLGKVNTGNAGGLYTEEDWEGNRLGSKAIAVHKANPNATAAEIFKKAPTADG